MERAGNDALAHFGKCGDALNLARRYRWPGMHCNALGRRSDCIAARTSRGTKSRRTRLARVRCAYESSLQPVWTSQSRRMRAAKGLGIGRGRRCERLGSASRVVDGASVQPFPDERVTRRRTRCDQLDASPRPDHTSRAGAVFGVGACPLPGRKSLVVALSCPRPGSHRSQSRPAHSQSGLRRALSAPPLPSCPSAGRSGDV